MPHEVAFAGVLLPGLLPVFVACLLLMVPLDLLLARLGAYRWVWHPSLLRLALFGGLFAGTGLLIVH